MTFVVALAQAANVSLALVAGKTSIPLLATQLQPGDDELPWSGATLAGPPVPDGSYRATLTVGDPPLAVTQSLPLTIDTTGTLNMTSAAFSLGDTRLDRDSND